MRIAGTAVLLGMFIGALMVKSETNYHHHSFAVTSVSPIVVQDLGAGGGFVVGTDGIARTCPDAKNVAEYIRPEGKGAALFFTYASTKAVIVSTPERGYTLACLKVE